MSGSHQRTVGLRYTGLASFPHPIVWKVSRVSNETAEAPDFRCTVWRQHPRPDATVGVLKVPLKGSRYSSRCIALRIYSHPFTYAPAEKGKADTRWTGPRMFVTFYDQVTVVATDTFSIRDNFLVNLHA